MNSKKWQKVLTDMMNKLFEIEGEKAPLSIIQPDKYKKTNKILEQQHKNIVRAIISRSPPVKQQADHI